MSTVIPVPPAPASGDAEPADDAPAGFESTFSGGDTGVADGVPPAWAAPPNPAGPLTGLYISMCGLILLVVSLIVAAGLIGAVWVLVLAVVALLAALWLLIAVLMRFIA